LATMTAVQPAGRWGSLDLEGDRIMEFREKLAGDGGWINGGFFVLSRKVLDYIAEDSTIWEREPLERLASEGNLNAYRHTGFWQPMDTLRDKLHLESLWQSGMAPWRRW
jgi:glucose-1-phosphate cytidylyltransferase